MKEEGLRAKTARKYKATMDSGHRMPVAENVLNREFEAVLPGEKFVSDITYLWTDEGWLYIAGVLDLYGHKMIGLSMGSRMTKDLVIVALEEAYRRSGRPSGTIVHSDRGSQYCSKNIGRNWKNMDLFVVCREKEIAGTIRRWKRFGEDEVRMAARVAFLHSRRSAGRSV